VERFTHAMSEDQHETQTLTPYALDQMTGFYVQVKNVEGLLRMLVFQSQPGERGICVADLLFTRDQLQEIAGVMGIAEPITT
jgi:hypothetical protein